MKVIQSGIFSRTIKKLHKKEKAAVDRAIRKIISNISIGDMKKSTLAGQVFGAGDTSKCNQTTIPFKSQRRARLPPA